MPSQYDQLVGIYRDDVEHPFGVVFSKFMVGSVASLHGWYIFAVAAVHMLDSIYPRPVILCRSIISCFEQSALQNTTVYVLGFHNPFVQSKHQYDNQNLEYEKYCYCRLAASAPNAGTLVSVDNVC